MRRAYVFGSDGTDTSLPLRFAHSDARKFAACIGRPQCGFSVDMPAPGATARDVREELATAAEDCEPNDTFVAYFAGHGSVEMGSLFLFWDSTDLRRLLRT